MDRISDRSKFYAIMEELRERVGGCRRLGECDAKSGWPHRGVYFFFERGEHRGGGADQLRIVRVGTHALRKNAKTSLWRRLAQHRGTVSTGAGNHRASIFRLLVGAALAAREPALSCATWEVKRAPCGVREGEHALECRVSEYIRAMPFLWVSVPDDASPAGARGYIERNSIGLLSNLGTDGASTDLPSEDWLGRWCPRERVRASGLWNSNHVDDAYAPAFLGVLHRLVRRMDAPDA